MQQSEVKRLPSNVPENTTFNIFQLSTNAVNTKVW